jgi:hypothetical protein
MNSAEPRPPTSMEASVFRDKSRQIDDGSTRCTAVSITGEQRPSAADIAFGAVNSDQELHPVDSKGFIHGVQPLPIALFAVRGNDDPRISTGKIQLHLSYLLRHRRGARGDKHEETENDRRSPQGR